LAQIREKKGRRVSSGLKRRKQNVDEFFHVLAQRGKKAYSGRDQRRNLDLRKTTPAIPKKGGKEVLFDPFR